MGRQGRLAVPARAAPDAIRDRVAVAFTTLLRPESATRLVESVLLHQPGVPVYCAIQGELPALVSRYERHPDVSFHRLEFDAGLSRARNELFRRIDRPYVLIVDDDMALTEETDLGAALAILDRRAEVGVVGGRYVREFKREGSDRPFVPSKPPRFEFFIDGYQGGVLRLRRIAERYGGSYETDTGSCYRADVVHNAALVRRSLVTEAGGAWDDAMKIGGEHLDFYLNVRDRRLCDVVFHAGLAVEHYRETGGDYASYRGRAVGTMALLRKWRLYRREVVGDPAEMVDYRFPPIPRRARAERIGLGPRARPVRRVAGRRLRGLAHPRRAVEAISRVMLEERYRRLFESSRADPMLQNVFLARDRSWLFVQASKCACTFVKRVLDEIEHGPERFDHEMDVHTRHRLDSGLTVEAGEVVDLLRSDRTWRFAFVRNPFLRVLSAWLDKFADASRTPSLTSIATDACIRHRRAGRDPHAPVGFREFLEYVSRQPRKEMDRHWRPVHDALAFGRVRYDFIGRVERLADDLAAVLETIGAHKHVRLARGAPSNVTDAGAALERHYDGACIDLVRSIYRIDFESFGYPDDPGRAVA